MEFKTPEIHWIKNPNGAFDLLMGTRRWCRDTLDEESEGELWEQVTKPRTYQFMFQSEEQLGLFLLRWMDEFRRYGMV